MSRMPNQKNQQINIFKIQGDSPNFKSGGVIGRHVLHKPKHLGDPPLDHSLSGYSGEPTTSYSVNWSRAMQSARHPEVNSPESSENCSADVRISDDGKILIKRKDIKRIARDLANTDIEFSEVDLAEFSSVGGIAGFSLPLGMSVKKNCKKNRPK